MRGKGEFCVELDSIDADLRPLDQGVYGNDVKVSWFAFAGYWLDAKRSAIVLNVSVIDFKSSAIDVNHSATDIKSYRPVLKSYATDVTKIAFQATSMAELLLSVTESVAKIAS